MPPPDPIDVLIVASWFPAYDDPAAGRFVADQAEALAATAVARPAVISFDGVRLSGGATGRARQESIVVAATRAAATRVSPLFTTGWGVEPTIPVARLAIADGQTPRSRTVHAAYHREAVIAAVAERIAASTSGAASGVVHAHTVYPDGAAAAIVAKRLGWPLFITEHSSTVERVVATPGQREMYAAAVGKAVKVFAVSETLAGELRDAFPEQADRFEVLPNAVPIDRFRIGGADERVADELLFVGYRKPTKGIENLLRGVAAARAWRPSITLRLLGRSPDEATEARWRSLAAELGLADAVTFEDPIDRAGIADAMARSSVFVHPSPRETFGVVAVEALAAGLPVVATDSGGVSEILGADADRLGALVPIDDPEALGAAIVATLERRESFEPSELRASVERRFGSAFVAERLLVAYREALAGSERSAGPGWAPFTGRAQAPDRIVVVALDRERAGLRLSPLPASLRRRLTLVTASRPSEVGLPEVGSVVEADVEPAWRPASGARSAHPGLAGRLSRLAADPIGTIRQRIGRGPGSAASLAPATNAIRETVAAAPEAEILPLDGHDHLAVAALGTAAPRLYGGGLRRLADAVSAESD